MKNLKFTIITFYQFKKNNEFDKFRIILDQFCSFHKIKGTILLANEGINGTVAGLNEPINLLEKELSKMGFSNLEKKKSLHKFMPFNRLKIKNKKEIVKFDNSGLNVENFSGKHINSLDWNHLINDDEVMLIDVRNEFEFKVGTFKGAVNPKTENFSEFKKYIYEKLDKKKDKKIAIFCTGGIRCEKASAYMISEGFQNVLQLKGGILQYLNDTPSENSKWEGECFVFDNRVSIQNAMIPGTYELCHACRNPLSIPDRQSKDYEKGISCPYCINKISNSKKSKLKERNKQIKIAIKKGLYNPYIKYTPSDYS
jgi:UPF0176 protein